MRRRSNYIARCFYNKHSTVDHLLFCVFILENRMAVYTLPIVFVVKTTKFMGKCDENSDYKDVISFHLHVVSATSSDGYVNMVLHGANFWL